MTETDLSAHYTAMRDRYHKSPTHAFLGLRLEDLEPGRAKVTLKARPELRNNRGSVHGGILGAMLDSAMFMSARTELSADDGLITIEMKTNYMLPAEGETITCLAEVVRMGGSTCVSEARIFDSEGKLAVISLGTLHVRRKKESE